jgi:hypothetical protein
MARRSEVADKKEASPVQVPLGAYTIRSFCQSHGLSEAMFFKMRLLNEGPDEMAFGRRRAISVEAAAKWRRKREAAARNASKAKEENAEIA